MPLRIQLRNRTSHGYDEAQAQAIAQDSVGFLADARQLLDRLEQVL